MNKEFKLIEENAQDAPVKDIEWEGKEVETETTPLMNNDTGKPIILRVFDFNLPSLKPEEFPTKEQLLNFHKSKVTAFLWRDELIPIQDFKLIFSKDKRHFRIFATCQTKAGSTVLERPQVLQKLING